MKRKGRTSMDRCVQILEMHRAGHSTNKIAKAPKMIKKTVRKVIEEQGVSAVLNSLQSGNAQHSNEQIPVWLVGS
jgi:hypothetical protein